jgi:uncharacterized protein (TIGR00661 family)
MKKNLRIAYSICGEGHGHYGRNVQILKELLKRFPKCTIDLYVYGDTMNIFQMDKSLSRRISIREIDGFRFIYKNTGLFTSIFSTALNPKNLGLFSRIVKMNIFFILMNFLKLFYKNKKINFFSKFSSNDFKYFDFAISDFEPFLPRIALLREKPFLTFDNQHAMIYGDFGIESFNLSEKIELFYITNYLKISYTKSDLTIITTFCEVPVKEKHKKLVKSVGPLIRNEIIKHKNKIKDKGYILIYAHKILVAKLFPLLTKLDKYKFIVFTTDNFEEKNYPYKRDWITFRHIDPNDFVEKLLNCKAVISTAGHTLLSEALFLKKPFFAVGLEGQFEQRLNVWLLEKYKWGEGCKLSRLEIRHLSDFMKNINRYKKNLSKAKIEDHTGRIVDLIQEKIKKDVI